MGEGIGEVGSEGHLSRTGITSFLVKEEMLVAHDLLTDGWLEEGQQITEQEYCCFSADRLATRADKGKRLSSKAAAQRRS